MADVMCAQAPIQLPGYAPMMASFVATPTQQPFQPQPQRIQLKTKDDQKKVYYCQRCLNHDRAEPRKNHKCECPFANCTCFKCSLVEKRRKLNLQLHELEGDQENKKDEDDDDRKLKGERVPNCQKCGQHGRKSRLKGHKRVCPFRDCKCPKCAVVSERQKLMADQIKIRRRQRKDTLMNLTREHITSSLNAVAAMHSQFNMTNLNALIYGSIKTTPQPLLSSPTSSASDASSYSPSLQFPSPSLSLLLPPSPESGSIASTNVSAQSPCTTTTSTAAAATAAAAAAPVVNALTLLGVTDPQLIQSLLAQMQTGGIAAALTAASSPPTSGEADEELLDEELDEDETDARLNSNCIIDVCSV